jgi:ATP-binding cassette subfamily B multidrug efflux pump
MFKFFEGLVDPYIDYDKNETPSRRLYPFLRNYARPFDRIFLIAGLLTVVIAASEILLLSYMGRLVDLLVGPPTNVWAEQGVEFVLVAVLILTLRPLVYGAQVVLLNNTILPNFPTLIRYRAHRHVLNQSIGWFENDFAGRIANRMMQTPPAAGEVVFQIFDAMAFAIAYVIGGMILLGDADPRLILPLLLWLVPYGLLLWWVVVKIGPASKASSEARSEVTARIVDSYTNVHSVKMFDHTDAEIDYATEVIENAREKFKYEMRLFTIMDVALTFMNGILIVGVVGYAVWLWFGSLASVGVVASATALALRLSAMSGWIMWAVSSFFRELGIVQEGMETIAQPVELVDAPEAKPLAFSSGKIEVKNLSHHYGRKSGGLDNVSLTIRPGEKVGLVGRSGAGKSTLVKLLLRFYDVESGQILIDGQDIAHIEQGSLRSQIGMVQQDSSLLHRSVRDNIIYSRPQATEADMIAAAKQAEAHEFILSLEDKDGRKGYDARVGERGVKLSGGQRQRIAIARVMLKDAPILLLDEATSALDSESEASIQQTLYGLMQGKTVVAIAHRLSTIAQMDRIIVMDQGRVVEDGSHETLLDLGGIYAGLWQRQSGGFLGK